VAALDRLSRAGISLGCQTVLLKGVNDDPKVMMKLMHELLKARVRPYYIYMADQVAGGEHFRTTVQKGLEIIQALRGWTSGLAVPQFVIDAPGGGGKVPLLPEYVEEITDDEVQRFSYKQPKPVGVPGLAPAIAAEAGIISIENGKAVKKKRAARSRKSANG
jgi:lysine 2,3-aminomutase